MRSTEIHSLKEYGVKSLIIICQALLIAANYIFNPVAPVSELICVGEITVSTFFIYGFEQYQGYS